MREEENAAYRFLWISGLIVLALVVLGAIVEMVLYPAWLDYQRKAIHSSIGYTETQVTAANGDIQNWQSLQTQIDSINTSTMAGQNLVRDLKVQQTSDVCDVRSTFGLLMQNPNAQVPVNIANFLAAHSDVSCP